MGNTPRVIIHLLIINVIFFFGSKVSGAISNDFLAKLICLSKSINISHLVNEQEQILLLNQLFACKDSKFTPENKKIYIAIEDKEINTKFK